MHTSKTIILFFIIIIGGIGALGFSSSLRGDEENSGHGAVIDSLEKFASYETTDLAFEHTNLTVWIADTALKQTNGLMHITKLPEDYGMLFVFDDVMPRTFWNKNTLIDLDVIWISNNTIVGITALSHQTDEEITLVSSPKAVDYVLEVGAGWTARHNIQVGSTYNMMPR
ncbi:MAG: hypothetical protein COU90_02240 [Candidatus Ryanbacteria bacterium CG10_big_fil_rev_8_21_14_0_10_43_42]|uniref:DUF192 domain-containing protein n=1 Tax=Candidatus Ryanbacteria bacterium CG10_big_fil_rev_8_21_14_0_10_43_42 TaxID=1974864 RepID=A0A2M8KXH5_9BACT|nr:MAG: hypothetical protein COU90_02240 [Candidatus Ryanbacteria bacterium CG10_big_fil_rev_8_21_14_0_10_43_42]